MTNVPPPLAAKEFFTPEFLKDPYPIYRRYLDGPGLQFLTIHGGVWAAFKQRIARHFFETPDSPLSVLAL
jgi:hypothetical protein